MEQSQEACFDEQRLKLSASEIRLYRAGRRNRMRGKGIIVERLGGGKGHEGYSKNSNLQCDIDRVRDSADARRVRAAAIA
jgi:hypothetical protein